MSEKSTMKEVDVTSTDNTNFTFTLDNNADCFCFYAYQKQKSDNAFVLQLTYNGKPYPQAQYNKLYAHEVTDQGISTAPSNAKDAQPSRAVKRNIPFSLPIADGELNSMNGTWSGVIVSGATTSELELRCTERIKVNNSPISRTLKVAPLLYIQEDTSEEVIGKQETWISATYKKISGIYEQAGINCAFETLKKETYVNEKSRMTLEELVKKYGSPNSILAIFAVHKKLRGDRSTVLGVSYGIPGPQGLSDRFSALLINMESGPNDALVQNADYLAHTIAHEMAHQLGLNHESSNEDRDNLSYRYVDKNYPPGNQLNDQQIFILQHMPIVEVEYADPHTPITELEVEIKTGTRSTSWFDNGGTSMRVQFGLASDTKTKRRWALNNGKNDYYFDAGETAKFKLSNIKDLYLDDLTTWNITCNWNAAYYYPINFLFIDDAWDFQHIKVTANGNLLLVDSTINRILSWASAIKIIEGKIIK